MKFLTARWEYLAMFNYEVDPIILKKHLPPFTELDLFKGKAIVSIVGFLFNNTKVFGIPWPGHINFEEVNLRFYIKRYDGKEWKRGVAFISEIVPKPLVSQMANLFYNEHYSTAKMSSNIFIKDKMIHVFYEWQKKGGQMNSMLVKASTDLNEIEKGSEEEFIFEHYYGYNKLNEKCTVEYTLKHEKWKTFSINEFELTCDVNNLYGNEFDPFISNKKPHSVFLAKGSDVAVNFPAKIKNRFQRDK